MKIIDLFAGIGGFSLADQIIKTMTTEQAFILSGFLIFAWAFARFIVAMYQQRNR